MIAVDTSVVVAGLASWHEAHDRASETLSGGVRLPAPCAVETYSVLTRLPPPHRVAGAVVRDLLRSRFAEALLTLDAAGYEELLDRLKERGISRGATYDGLVCFTAARHGARLLSRDRRAARVYEALGVDFELVT